MCGYYSRAATIGGQRLIKEIQYVLLLDYDKKYLRQKNLAALNALNYYYTHQERGCLGQCEASSDIVHANLVCVYCLFIVHLLFTTLICILKIQLVDSIALCNTV